MQILSWLPLPYVAIDNDKDSLIADTSVVADRDDYDWTPEEFKKEHYDEWLVVKTAILPRKPL